MRNYQLQRINYANDFFVKLSQIYGESYQKTDIWSL